MPKEPFKADLDQIRKRAREKMMQGAVTGAYRADVDKVCEVLNEVLATEIMCVMRYKANYFAATGLHSEAVAEEFKVHAAEEQQHADQVAERITQLGGTPEMNPEVVAKRSHSQYAQTTDLKQMIVENLVAERVAIETYSEIIRWLGDDDSTTTRMMRDILATEEEHADDMAGLLERWGES